MAAWCSRRTLVVWAALALADVASGSCAYRRELTPPPIAAPAPGAAGDWSRTPLAHRNQRILSYRTADGVRHHFDGEVRLDGDSLRFHRLAEMAPDVPQEPSRFALPPSNVRSVARPVAHVWALPIVIIGVALAGLLAFAGPPGAL